KLKQLLTNRIDKLRRNDVQRRIRSRVGRRGTLRCLQRHALVHLAHQNSARIIELAVLIASRELNRHELSLEEHKLLVDVGVAIRREAELRSDVRRYDAGGRSHEVVEVTR